MVAGGERLVSRTELNAENWDKVSAAPYANQENYTSI